MDIPQKAHIGIRDEFWNFAGIIRIWEGVRSWPAAGVDYDSKIDIGVERDSGGVLATVDPRLWDLQIFLVAFVCVASCVVDAQMGCWSLLCLWRVTGRLGGLGVKWSCLGTKEIGMEGPGWMESGK